MKGYKINEPIKFILNLIENLIKRKILGKNDLERYEAFIKDLYNFGFIFSPNFKNQINFNENNYLSKHSKLKYK